MARLPRLGYPSHWVAMIDRNPSLTWFLVIMAMVLLITIWLYVQPEVWTEWGR